MSRTLRTVWLAATAGLAAACAWGQETPASVSMPMASYKVVIWYSKRDPIGTFQYQVYDVGKGEYTKAVDEWLERMKMSHLNYIAYVRYVDLNREPGATEKLKVGSVIQRELMVAAALSGVGMAAVAAPGLPRIEARRPLPIAPLNLGPVRQPPAYLQPSPYLFPTPMPYPRPHP